MKRLVPLLALAGLAGLVAERSGTVNIGIEGMMVMGTIFAGWWGWEFGPWMAVIGGTLAMATTLGSRAAIRSHISRNSTSKASIGTM